MVRMPSLSFANSLLGSFLSVREVRNRPTTNGTLSDVMTADNDNFYGPSKLVTKDVCHVGLDNGFINESPKCWMALFGKSRV